MFESRLLTLDDVIKEDYFFSIPIYQRLYVWGPEQVNILLSDIWQACKEVNDVFYLGGTLAIERPPAIGAPFAHQLFDLIDGQQRFTTMWLISLVWDQCLAEYQQKSVKGQSLHRISFAIRPQVTQFFDAVISKKQDVALEDSPQLINAIETIKSFVSAREKDGDIVDLLALTEFIRTKVQFVFTTVPKNTDLNKLFEVINNRGVQLQHHEILKARLLQNISTDEREAYGRLWDACSHMGNYLEKNIRDAADIKVSELFDNEQSKSDAELLADPNAVIAKLLQQSTNQSEDKHLSLLSILQSPIEFEDKTPKNEDEFEAEKVRSIISFSMLLQHVLRIFLFKQNKADLDKVLDKDLITLFDKYWLRPKLQPLPSEEDTKAFIRLLWKTRYLFDKYIIKWVDTDGEEVHGVRTLYNKKNTNKSITLSRSIESKKDFAMLQSMLYHSQQMTTHYWLTPLLGYLADHGGENIELYLQHLDNHLLNAHAYDKGLIERTRLLLAEPWQRNKLRFGNDALNKQLSASFTNGTQYAHYWFYKLEYVLYLALAEDPSRKSWRESFRMTAKNSVEHIAPQNAQLASEQVTAKHLHNFGNLALVTRSLNSEMSNRSFEEKQVAFLKHHHNKGTCLKLEYVFEHKQWDATYINVHQEQMIEMFDRYLNKVDQRVKELKDKI